MQELDLLILGAGWVATFVIPLLQARQLSFAATTRDGRKVAGVDTIPWSFDDPGEDGAAATKSDFSALPLAKHVLVTFPLKGPGRSRALVRGYEAVYGAKADIRFVQLGSTGIWQIPQESHWVSRHSPYDKSNARAVAEDELLELGGCVVNLAGLWGGERDPKQWVERVAKTKEEVRGKKSLHMIHGVDVARAIAAIMGDWSHGKSQRWMLTDGYVYDWWALFGGWADAKQDGAGEDQVDREPSPQAKWVFELMAEENVQALPRSMDALGRCYAGREFWDTFKLAPLRARL